MKEIVINTVPNMPNGSAAIIGLPANVGTQSRFGSDAECNRVLAAQRMRRGVGAQITADGIPVISTENPIYYDPRYSNYNIVWTQMLFLLGRSATGKPLNVTAKVVFK